MGRAIQKKASIEWDGRSDLCVNGDMTCCALLELGSISAVDDPFTTLVDLAVEYYSLAPIVLFTSINKHLSGDRLMDFIHKHRLGRVTFSKGVKNFNDTGNTVYLYTWIVNRGAWQKYATEINEQYTPPNNYSDW